jgi:hypothetical protein
MFKNSIRTSKRTPQVTIKISWLMPFKEAIAVYSENLTKPIIPNTAVHTFRIAGT